MTGRVGQIGRRPWRAGPAAPSGAAALVAVSLLAALGLSACGPDVAGAATVLGDARAAVVQLAGGAQRPAVTGMTVPRGATVHTAPGGSAALLTAGRTVLLGSETAVTVLDGAREQLRAGLVMIDSRRAPGLSLDAGAATVQTVPDGLARVERGLLLRAVSYRHTLTVRAASRKVQTPVPSLQQVQVPDGGLPGRVTPLALTPNDSWERRYVLDLVTADADLVALADGLSRNPASSAAVLQTLPASYVAAVPTTPTAVVEPASEAALAYAVAQAARRGPSGYGTVRADRADGGSWGVVAALVGARVAAVSAVLDGVLAPAPATPLQAAAPSGPVPPGSLLSGVGGTSSASPPATAAPAVQPAGSPAPRRPGPSPSSAPAPPNPVQNLVTTVTHLLPSAVPLPVAPLAPPARPSPTPAASVQLGGLSVTVG